MKKSIVLSFCLLSGAGLDAVVKDMEDSILGEIVVISAPEVVQYPRPVMPDEERMLPLADWCAARMMCNFDEKNEFAVGEIVLVPRSDLTFRWGRVIEQYDDSHSPCSLLWLVRVRPGVGPFGTKLVPSEFMGKQR